MLLDRSYLTFSIFALPSQLKVVFLRPFLDHFPRFKSQQVEFCILHFIEHFLEYAPNMAEKMLSELRKAIAAPKMVMPRDL